MTTNGQHPRALAVSGLTVRYGATTALDRVDLDLAAGSVTGLIGMNGSGKSTFFKALMGLVRPTAGRIEMFGGAPERARASGQVAYAPQSEEIDWTFPLSVADVVAMGRYPHCGRSRRLRAPDRVIVAESIERVGLAGLAGRQVGALSGGQRKRAFVARALAQEADLMLLDEPFAGVDRATQQVLSDLLRELAAAGAAVLVSTHDLDGLPALCDSAALLQRRLVVHAAPEEVLRPENLARAFHTSEIS